MLEAVIFGIVVIASIIVYASAGCAPIKGEIQ